MGTKMTETGLQHGVCFDCDKTVQELINEAYRRGLEDAKKALPPKLDFKMETGYERQEFIDAIDTSDDSNEAERIDTHNFTIHRCHQAIDNLVQSDNK